MTKYRVFQHENNQVSIVPDNIDITFKGHLKEEIGSLEVDYKDIDRISVVHGKDRIDVKVGGLKKASFQPRDKKIK